MNLNLPFSPDRLLARVCLSLCLAVPLACSEDSPPPDEEQELPLEVETQQGPVRGFIQEDVARTFLGIPYAKPPVGPLRFALPEPAEPWADTREATAWSPACMQNESTAQTQSEDCLYLNVFTPKSMRRSEREQGLPVMVWIHGGRYLTGETSMFPGHNLAARGDVVYVSIAYRLNAFGFFANPQMASAGTQNLGLRDQLLALKWIRDNIHQFGGDPNRVTLFGESGGGNAVMMHLLMEESRGLVHAGIIQSLWQVLQPTTAQTLSAADTLAVRVGCPNAAAIDCLRAVPAATLLPRVSQSHRFIPQVDGKLLPDQPLRMLRQGRFHRQVPVVLGYTAQEGHFLAYSRSGWVIPPNDITYSRFVSASTTSLNPLLDPATIDKAISWYTPVAQQQGNWMALARLTEDYFITCGSLYALQAFAQYSEKPVHAYLWDYTSTNNPEPFLKASHGNELPFILDAPVYVPFEKNEADRRLIDRMIASWASMAHHEGAPSTESEPWQPYTSQAPQAYLWQEPNAQKMVPFSPDIIPQCQQWLTVFDPPAAP